MKFQRPRGTHDITPEQIPSWRFVEETFRAICARSGFHEIRTPLFESTELFSRASGESSDVVVTKQMYSFVAPDEQSYTLRPEGTASVVRAYLENNLNERGPVAKLFYIFPVFRYEAPQAGRYRQHHQCGIEMLGASGPEADAEVLALSRDFLQALGIEPVLKINSLGTLESRREYVAKLRAHLEPNREKLSEDSRRRLEVNPLRVFDSKDARDIEALIDAPRLLDHLREADEASTKHFETLCGLLEQLEIPFEIDHNLVRGFDYYSQTAFEWVSDKLGAQSTVLGGGRYDGLVEELGGAPTPGIGFGAGIERLLLGARSVRSFNR
jgi:histidyl-tRNA synthetase